MAVEGEPTSRERPRSAFAQKLLDDPALAARLEQMVQELRAEAIATDPTLADDDGTQKWPMVGGHVWVGDPERSPYGPNGEDILVGGE